MFDISSAGGAPKVLVDLIDTLNNLGKEVHLLIPFKLDYKLIEDLYGPIKIKKVYYPSKLKSLVCKGNFLPRRFMKKEFQKMANKVDMIIDIDGGIIHKYLPKCFDQSKYVVWRFSCLASKIKQSWSLKRKAKETLKIILGSEKCMPIKKYKIYTVDEWTRKVIEKIGLKAEEMGLYPAVNVEKFFNNNSKKKKQVVIFGRIAPNKFIEDSVKVFGYGTRKHPEYELIIMGGATADSGDYIKLLKDLMTKFNIKNRTRIIKSPTLKQVKETLIESEVLLSSQQNISITLTSIEAMAAGCIVLNHKDSGTYLELLEEGKYGYGFVTPREGGEQLEKILTGLKDKTINNKKSINRSKAFSRAEFTKQLRNVINGR